MATILTVDDSVTDRTNPIHKRSSCLFLKSERRQESKNPKEIKIVKFRVLATRNLSFRYNDGFSRISAFILIISKN